MPNSIRELIKEMERRPEIYIGERSLSLLNAFINGWIYRNEASVIDINLLANFQDWIQKKYQITSSHSWARIISFHSSSDYKAFDRFFNLFNEFLEELFPIHEDYSL